MNIISGPASIAKAALLISILILGASCTKKADTGTVRLVMPTAPTSAKVASKAATKAGSATGTVTSQSGDSFNSSLNPTVGSDVNCYAVFIGGGDLAANSCTIGETEATASTIKFGPNVGFVPAGGEILIETPAGPRIIYVIGLHAGTTAACSSYQNSEPDSSNLSDPFLIATQPADIPSGASTVTIAPKLDTTKKVLDCKFMQGGGGSNSSPFGDKREGTITSTPSTLMQAGSATLSSVTTRSGSSSLPNSKVFAASRRITSVATSGAYPGAALTLGTAFTANDFDGGDEVVWYVAAGSSTLGSPDDAVLGACGGALYLGRYGTARIKSVDPVGDVVVLDRPISGSPATIRTANFSAPPTAPDYCTVILSRVSSFDKIALDGGYSLTMKVEPFNYMTGTGGLLMVRADSISLGVGTTFKIDGDSAGFVGGAASVGNLFQGDGVNRKGVLSTSSNYNGGGAGNASTLGGGGGGHAGAGGQGAAVGGMGGSPLNHCMGGLPCSPLSEQKVFMGGGGGAAGATGNGGIGGGVVILYAGSISGGGTLALSAAGGHGVAGAAGSGGGAGGAIGLMNRSSSVPGVSLSTNAGMGGSGTVGGGGGGGGVTNFVRCQPTFTSALTSSALGGTGGPSGANGNIGLQSIVNDSSVCAP